MWEKLSDDEYFQFFALFHSCDLFQKHLSQSQEIIATVFWVGPNYILVL